MDTFNRVVRTFLPLVAIASLQVFAAPEIAKVNGVAITQDEMEKALSGYNEVQKQQILKDEVSRGQVIDNLIDQELLLQEAKKKNLENSAEFKAALETFRKQYLSNLYLEKELDSKLTDKEARAYYQRNRTLFSSTQVRAQHILVYSKQEAEGLIKKLKAPNVDFQEYAEKFSKDPSAKNNRGDLGYFTRDAMAPEFTEAAFDAKEGAIVGPVKTSFGWHVIKVVDRKPGDLLNFEEVELKVRTALRQSLVQQLLGKLRNSAKIQKASK